MNSGLNSMSQRFWKRQRVEKSQDGPWSVHFLYSREAELKGPGISKNPTTRYQSATSSRHELHGRQS